MTGCVELNEPGMLHFQEAQDEEMDDQINDGVWEGEVEEWGPDEGDESEPTDGDEDLPGEPDYGGRD